VSGRYISVIIRHKVFVRAEGRRLVKAAKQYSKISHWLVTVAIREKQTKYYLSTRYMMNLLSFSTQEQMNGMSISNGAMIP